MKDSPLIYIIILIVTLYAAFMLGTTYPDRRYVNTPRSFPCQADDLLGHRKLILPNLPDKITCISLDELRGN